MDLHLPAGNGTLPTKVYLAVAAMIEDGRLLPGDALPASRALARQLGLSRTTVTTAYERLAGEGYTVGEPGSATRVSQRDHGLSATAAEQAEDEQDAPGLEEGPCTADFRLGSPDIALFPYPAWRRALLAAVRPARTPVQHQGDPQGQPELRRALARHLATSRSVVGGPGRVLVTAGAQQAFTILARVAAQPGDTIAVESPGYFLAAPAFEAAGLHVAHVPVDEDGILVEAIPPRARLVYVTPSHQQPTAVTMSLARRDALLAWAETHDGLIIEDDYDSEFRFVGRPLEPLQRTGGGRRVAYLGSFSKTMLPGIRVGYAVLPEPLVARATAARELLDRHGDITTQAALATFIETGDYAAHLRRSRRRYWRRRDALVAALREIASLEVFEPAAGLHLRADLRDARPGTSARIAAACARDGVLVDALGAGSSWGGAHEALLFGYGSLRDEDIERGVHTVARALHND